MLLSMENNMFVHFYDIRTKTWTSIHEGDPHPACDTTRAHLDRARNMPAIVVCAGDGAYFLGQLLQFIPPDPEITHGVV